MLAATEDTSKVPHDVDTSQRLDYNPQSLRHSTAKCVLIFGTLDILFCRSLQKQPSKTSYWKRVAVITDVMSSCNGAGVSNYWPNQSQLFFPHCTMNRSPLAVETVLPSFSSSSSSDWLPDLEDPAQSTLRQSGVSHCLFAPIHYEQGYAYPLIVWLHSSASNEQELRDVMPLVSVRNYVGVAPRGTEQTTNLRGGFQWDQSSHSIAEAYERVRHSIRTAQDRFHIHPDRIFVAGFAEGGTMALRLGLEHPNQFAGAISLGGPLPTGESPLKRIDEVRQLPLLLSVSPDEEKFPISRAMDNVRLLHSAGASLSLRLYPEGDELTTVMLSDVNNWIMERVCSTNAAVVS